MKCQNTWRSQNIRNRKGFDKKPPHRIAQSAACIELRFVTTLNPQRSFPTIKRKVGADAKFANRVLIQAHDAVNMIYFAHADICGASELAFAFSENFCKSLR